MKKTFEFYARGKKRVLTGQQMLELYEKRLSPEKLEGQMLIVIGGDDGSILAYLSRKLEFRYIVVVEPVAQIANRRVVRENYRKLEKQSHGLVRYFSDIDDPKHSQELFMHLMKLGTLLHSSEVIVNPIYETFFPEESKKAAETIKRFAVEAVTSKGNSVQDELYGLRNALYNLARYPESLTLKDFPKLETIISVAAGPSLDDHMSELKVLSQKYPVIAVDVVWEKLLQEGIKPDFVCSQERVLQVYRTSFERRGPFPSESVYVPQIYTHPYAVNSAEKIMFVARPSIPLNLYLQKRFYTDTPGVDTSTNVGLMNLTVATLFKPKNVLLFGQDLAYKKDKTHAGGVDTRFVRLNKKELEEVEGNRGEPVLVSTLFKRFILNFERYIAQHRSTRFYNFSDGAKIPGTIDSSVEIFKKFAFESVAKPSLADMLRVVRTDRDHLLKYLEEERSILETQMELLRSLLKSDENVEELQKQLAVNLLFGKLTMLHTVIEIAATPFLVRLLSRKERDLNWIRENVESFLYIAELIEEILKRAERLLKGEKLPDMNAPFSELYDFMLFEVIQDNSFDDRGVLRSDLSLEELKYAMKSFLNALNPLNYDHMVKVLKALIPHEEDKEVRMLKERALKDIYGAIKLNWEVYKNTDPLLRYPLAAYAHDAGDHEYVVSFLEQFDDLTNAEKFVLVDSYLRTGRFEKAAALYLDLLQKNMSDVLVINAMKVFIELGHLAEAFALAKKYGSFASHRREYQKNLEALEGMIASLESDVDTPVGKLPLGLIKDSDVIDKLSSTIEELAGEKGEKRRFSYAKDISWIDEALDVFAKQNRQLIFLKDGVYTYYVLKNPDFGYFNRELDFTYFVEKPDYHA